MKRLMILGGLIGFGLTFSSGAMTEGCLWPAILGRACLGALIGGVMLRWLGRVWLNCVRQTIADQVAAREKQESQAHQPNK